MISKPIATRWGLTLLLCLFWSIALSQTSAESSQTILVMQKGEKEHLAVPGDQIRIKEKGKKRRFAGELAYVTDSTITVRGRIIPLASLEQISVGSRPFRKLAIALLLIGLLGPILVGAIIRVIFRLAPPSPNIYRNNAWVKFNTWLANTWLGSLLLSAIFGLFARKRFKLNKWKLKVRRR